MLNIQIDSRNRNMFIKKDLYKLNEIELNYFEATVGQLRKETGYKIIVVPQHTKIEID